MNRTEYLENLTGQIHNKHARELVREELCAHIDDQKEAYLLAGKTNEEAEELAVKEMGDPLDTGAKLDKIHRPKTDVWMFGTMAILTLIGIIMQSIICAAQEETWMYSAYFGRTILFNLIGLAVMLLVYFGDYRILGKHAGIFYGVYLAAAVILPHTPYYAEYSHHLMLGQTINFLFLPLFAAFCYYFRGQKAAGILKVSALLIFNTLFILLTGSYVSGAMILSVMTCLITLCAAAFKGIFGGNKKLQGCLLTVLSLGTPSAILADILLFHGRFLSLAEYQILRIQVMLNPSAYYDGAAYQTMLIRTQLSEATLLGGGSIGKMGEFSGAFCDFVLICLTSYFGLLIAFAVVAAIIACLVRALHISFTQHNRLGFLLGIACSSILILKTILYVAMNVGAGPIIGIDMPFLTYGFHCNVLNFLFMGIILTVYRNTNLLPEYRETPIHFRLRIERVSGK